MSNNTNLLDLKSERWNELYHHIDEIEGPASCVAKWWKMLGTPDELEAYLDVREQYLHQNTLAACGYAIVPYVVSAAEAAKSTEIKLQYLEDAAIFESIRLTPEQRKQLLENLDCDPQLKSLGDIGVILRAAQEKRAEVLPSDLEPAYFRAMATAKTLVANASHEKVNPEQKARIEEIRARLASRDG